MKTFKEHPILGLCLFMFVCASWLFVQSKQITPLENYRATDAVLINDGATSIVSYDIHKSTVENALKDLHITLNEEDSLNLELSHELQNGDVIEITRVTYEEERKQVSVPFETVYAESKDPTLVGNKIVELGTPGIKDIIYNVKKINGEKVSSETIGEEITTEPIHRTLEVGTITTGEIYSGRITSYGADCIGCGTRTAAGLYVTTTGVKNEPTATLTFNGGEYYVLAADRQFPFGTILKVYNHSYDIPDPFYGIVLDRGGAVKGTKLDLYSGSQRTPLFGGHGGMMEFEVIAYGDGRTSIY